LDSIANVEAIASDYTIADVGFELEDSAAGKDVPDDFVLTRLVNMVFYTSSIHLT
jgi:hypothetical protein